jgi:hypothetical protein
LPGNIRPRGRELRCQQADFGERFLERGRRGIKKGGPLRRVQGPFD